ncbi:hypothetical protein WA171_003294, partial [Blastocystis sp. BT1]
MEYPDPESQEEEEIIEEIDTSAIQKESVQKKEEDNLNPSEGSAEEFQKVLLNMLSGIMGTDANGNPNPEFEAFARDFKEGFSTGASASQQYSQYVQAASETGNSSVGPAIQLLFGASSGLSWIITFIFFIFGFQTTPTIYYVILSLCVLRLTFFFFLAKPEQTASLTSIPSILGWLLTLLNIVSSSSLGDILAVVIDSFLYSIKLYARFRFNMFLSCWILGHIPEVDPQIFSYFGNLNQVLLLVVPLLSALVVLILFIHERRQQRRNVLFLQNFLSVFTNPEMQDSEIKGLLGSHNEILDEDKMKMIVTDAYAIYKNIPREESEAFVNMYFKRAVQEYN